MEEKASHLLTLAAIRERCSPIYERACSGTAKYFRVDTSRFDAVADYVIEVIQKNYPSGVIPYHSRLRHFSVGNVDRVAQLKKTLSRESPEEVQRRLFELVITSVLLDAGAGEKWSYLEKQSGASFNRSEGLAVASFHMFASGMFSKTGEACVDLEKLQALKLQDLAQGFQVTASNPMTGLEGRLTLLNHLGKKGGRLGAFYDQVMRSKKGTLTASDVFQGVLSSFNEIWPSRLKLDGVALGDCWKYGETYVPFHKLSQWLTYSLIEVLELGGEKISGIDAMTGLPEYRNGGLFIDLNVFVPKTSDALKVPYKPDSELIVEWRALTVIALDRLADVIRRKLHSTRDDLPLARILEGGTWHAGRKIAKALRPDGRPPITLDSDGTVF